MQYQQTPAVASGLPASSLGSPESGVGPRLLYWFAAAAIALAGLLIGFTLDLFRTQSLAASLRLTESFAHVVSDDIAGAVQNIDQSLQLGQGAIADLKRSGQLNQAAVGRMLSSQVKKLPLVRAMWVMDKTGRIEFESTAGYIGLDLADRDYFQIYAAEPKTEFFMGQPLRGKATGIWFLSASRPLYDADGNFTGAIVAAIEPRHMEETWKSVELGDGGSIALFRRDGTLMARSPFEEAAIGKKFIRGPIFSELLLKSSAGRLQAPSGVDGKVRSFAYRTLNAYPALVVVVGQSVDLVLTPWRKLAVLAIAIWAVASAAVVTFCIFLDRAWQLQARGKAEALLMFNRLSLATDAASIGVWEWEIDKEDKWFATPTYFTAMGYAVNEGLADRDQWATRLHPDDKDAVMAKIHAVLAGGNVVYEYEARLMHADGAYRWVKVAGRVLARDSAGKPTRLIGVRIDITDIKESEELMRKSEAKYKALFDEAPDGMNIVDRNGNFVDVNPSMCSMLGRPRDELLTMNAADIVIASEVAHIKPTILSITHYSSHHQEWRLTHKDGSIVDTDVIAIEMPDGNLLGMVRDVTNRKLVEAALLESEERYRLLVDQSPYSIAIHQDGKLRLFNRASLNLFGAVSPSELVDKEVLSLVHPNSREEAQNRIRRMLAGESSLYPAEYLFLKLDGTTFDGEVSAVPFTFQGRPAIQVIALDISKRKKAEVALLDHQKRLKAVSRRVLEVQEAERRRVAVELHDELGQALTAIKINLHSRDLLLEPARGQSHAALNRENLRIVEDALQQVRRLALTLRPAVLDDLGLAPALRWLIDQSIEHNGFAARFDSQLPPGRLLPEVETAFFRIAQAGLTNVVRHAQARQVSLTLVQDGATLVMTLQDDGVGFVASLMWARAKAGGSIGVLGMEERASLIGAHFSVEAAPGLGTTLRLSCTLQPKEHSA